MKTISNADHIRSMTDEELSLWIERIRTCCECVTFTSHCPLTEICFSKKEKPEATLAWLKQSKINSDYY